MAKGGGSGGAAAGAVMGTGGMRRRSLLGGLAGLAAVRPALAQGFTPDRPIRIVVPYPPGGVTDLVGRVVADGLRERLGWAAVVENKPGANGQIGMGEVSRARADGHTLLIGGLGSHVTPAALSPTFPFDIDRDFTIVAKLAEFVNVLVVNPALPVASARELVEMAKAKPGELNFGSSGLGASNHLTAELFALETGIRLTHIPARGAPASILALRQGEIQLIFENLPAVRGQIADGALRALAVTSGYRSRFLPEVPTLAEAGIPGVEVASWIALYGPPGLSAMVRDTLSDAAVAIVEGEAGRRRLEQVGFEVRPLRTGPAASFQAAELHRWRDLVRRADIRIDG